MLNTSIKIALFILLSVVCSQGIAQPEKYIEGTHYTVLSSPVQTGDPSKIEVLEAFWYGCPHCYSFEPLIVDWAKNSPSDVVFTRFPAKFNKLMKIHAQIFFTAQTLNVLDVIHNPAFEALILENKKLQSESQISEFFNALGIKSNDFEKAFTSFSVRTRLQQAEIRMKDYDLRGTPSMIVNGKYRVMTGNSVPTQQEMLQVVDFLIEKERRLH